MPPETAGPPLGETGAPGPTTFLRAILCFLVFVLLVDLPGAHLIEPDETRYAEISREMLASGDYLAPRLNGARYWEKPPLTYWLDAASLAAFGVNPFAARLPARLAALSTLALLLLGAGGRDPLPVRLWSGVIWLSAPLSFALGRANLTDGILAGCTTGAFLALRALVVPAEGGSRAATWWLGLCVGLGVLAKGLVAIVLPGGVLLAWALLLGRWDAVRRVLLSPAPLLALAITVPCFVLLEGAAPGFNHHFWVVEHLLRYATPEAERPGPPWYFLAVMAAGMLPWTGHLVASAPRLRRPRREELRAHADAAFLWLWLLGIVAFFSASKSKLAPYVLPAVPAACILAARAVVAGGIGGGRAVGAMAATWGVLGVSVVVAAFHPRVAGEGLRGAAVAMGTVLMVAALLAAALRRRRPAAASPVLALGAAGILAVGVAALPTVSAIKPFAAFAERMAREEREEGAAAVTFRCHANAIPLRLGHPVIVVSHRDEMGTDGVLPPDLFPRARDFWPRWDRGERMVVMIRDKDREELVRRRAGPTARVLAEHGEYLLVANYPESRR